MNRQRLLVSFATLVLVGTTLWWLMLPNNTSAQGPATPLNRSRSSFTGPKMVPSTVMERLLEKQKNNPAISAQALAELGNELIAAKGFNFAFRTGPDSAPEGHRDESFDEPRMFSFDLMDLRGREKKYELRVESCANLCGCNYDFPLLQISRKRMTLVADGAPIELVRPTDFMLDEITLLDESRKRARRTWYNYADMPPIGISQDGTRIYLRTGNDALNFPALAVEMGETGTPRIVTLPDDNIITEFEFTQAWPVRVPNRDVRYIRFKGQGKSYLVRFPYACT